MSYIFCCDHRQPNPPIRASISSCIKEGTQRPFWLDVIFLSLRPQFSVQTGCFLVRSCRTKIKDWLSGRDTGFTFWWPSFPCNVVRWPLRQQETEGTNSAGLLNQSSSRGLGFKLVVLPTLVRTFTSVRLLNTVTCQKPRNQQRPHHKHVHFRIRCKDLKPWLRQQLINLQPEALLVKQSKKSCWPWVPLSSFHLGGNFKCSVKSGSLKNWYPQETQAMLLFPDSYF